MLDVNDLPKKKGVQKPKPAETLYFDALLPNANASVFLLARMAMIRAEEIHFGSRPMVATEENDKDATIALREIAEGKVTFSSNGFKTGKDGTITKKGDGNGRQGEEGQGQD